LPQDMMEGMKKAMKTSNFLQETAGERSSQGTRVLRQKICYMVLVASIMLT
jgi:hypothetical protein